MLTAERRKRAFFHTKARMQSRHGLCISYKEYLELGKSIFQEGTFVGFGGKRSYYILSFRGVVLPVVYDKDIRNIVTVLPICVFAREPWNSFDYKLKDYADFSFNKAQKDESYYCLGYCSAMNADCRKLHKKLIRQDIHLARRDHKDGTIQKGQRYMVSVYHAWREGGPGWIYEKKYKVS